MCRSQVNKKLARPQQLHIKYTYSINSPFTCIDFIKFLLYKEDFVKRGNITFRVISEAELQTRLHYE